MQWQLASSVSATPSSRLHSSLPNGCAVCNDPQGRLSAPRLPVHWIHRPAGDVMDVYRDSEGNPGEGKGVWKPCCRGGGAPTGRILLALW